VRRHPWQSHEYDRSIAADTRKKAAVLMDWLFRVFAEVDDVQSLDSSTDEVEHDAGDVARIDSWRIVVRRVDQAGKHRIRFLQATAFPFDSRADRVGYIKTIAGVRRPGKLRYSVRRAKARSSTGCESLPARSNRSSRGGNEAAEAFDVVGFARGLSKPARHKPIRSVDYWVNSG